MKTTPAKFLIVDDDKVSVMAMQRAMRKLKIVNETAVCHDGQHALEFLAEEVKRHGRLPPYIVTLDLNMPRMDGIEFLRELRRDPVHSNAIVFVLTTSREEKDRVNAYALNVAGYIVRSDFGAGLQRVIDLLESYWKIVEFPARKSSP